VSNECNLILYKTIDTIDVKLHNVVYSNNKKLKIFNNKNYQKTMEQDYQYTFEDMLEGATLSHLYVQNRNVNEINKLSKNVILSKDIEGETALHYAATNNDVEICKILIGKCPELLYIKDIDSKTAYDWAKIYNDEYNNNLEVCLYLKSLMSISNE
jgi:ankyrin repeat protein